MCTHIYIYIYICAHMYGDLRRTERGGAAEGAGTRNTT